MDNTLKKYLFDIIGCIEYIEMYVGKKRFSSFIKNKQLIHSVNYNIMVIGEAMNNILRIDPEIKISNGRNIVNARNLLIHNYSGVNENVLWEIIKIHLPILKEEVGNILND